MKKLVKSGIVIIMIMMLAGGCGKKEETQKQKLYPVSINGTEIRVGETTVQSLTDAGLRITVSESTEDFSDISHFEIDPDQQLEANTYYSGGTIWISDSLFAFISVATGDEAVTMGDAVIARLEFNMANAGDDELSGIQFDGVPVSEITREKAEEMCPDFSGDEHMWLQYGLDYKYDLNFDSTGKMISFAIERKYDVDWSAANEEE